MFSIYLIAIKSVYNFRTDIYASSFLIPQSVHCNDEKNEWYNTIDKTLAFEDKITL